jgi:hypothetical protein
MGSVEDRVREDIEELGELRGIQGSLAEIAYSLARYLDHDPGLATAGVAKQLTETLVRIKDLGSSAKPSDGFLEGMPTPVGDTADTGKSNVRPIRG